MSSRRSANKLPTSPSALGPLTVSSSRLPMVHLLHILLSQTLFLSTLAKFIPLTAPTKALPDGVYKISNDLRTLGMDESASTGTPIFVTSDSDAADYSVRNDCSTIFSSR